MTIRINWKHNEYDGIGYVHIPKTGGTSIEYLLVTDMRSHCNVETSRHAFYSSGYIPDNYYTFTCFRNPYERAVSWYNQLINEQNVNKRFSVIENHSFDYMLKEWFTVELDPELFALAHSFKPSDPQVKWITKDNKVAVNSVMFLDTIDKDFTEIIKYISGNNNLPLIKVPKHNVGGHTATGKYTKPLKDIVDKFYADDIDFWKQHRGVDPWCDLFYSNE